MSTEVVRPLADAPAPRASQPRCSASSATPPTARMHSAPTWIASRSSRRQRQRVPPRRRPRPAL